MLLTCTTSFLKRVYQAWIYSILNIHRIHQTQKGFHILPHVYAWCNHNLKRNCGHTNTLNGIYHPTEYTHAGYLFIAIIIAAVEGYLYACNTTFLQEGNPCGRQQYAIGFESDANVLLREEIKDLIKVRMQQCLATGQGHFQQAHINRLLKNMNPLLASQHPYRLVLHLLLR